MPDEQPMEPSEPEQTARPEAAAPPQPDARAEPPQPTQEDPPPAESADRDAQPPRAEPPAAPADRAQPPPPSEQATPEQTPDPEAGADADSAAGTDADSEAGTDADSAAGAGTGPEAGADADSAADTGTDPEAGTGTDSAAEGPSLDEVIRERDAHRDDLLRERADFANYKKRTERERRVLIEQAAGDLLGDLLPVVDDLELALAADAQDGESYRRGVEGIRRKLLDVMARRGVARIEAVGADFDPTLHEAMTYEPAEGRRDGEVVEDLRRGYTLRGKLLRASMVKVAKA